MIEVKSMNKKELNIFFKEQIKKLESITHNVLVVKGPTYLVKSKCHYVAKLKVLVKEDSKLTRLANITYDLDLNSRNNYEIETNIKYSFSELCMQAVSVLGNNVVGIRCDVLSKRERQQKEYVR